MSQTKEDLIRRDMRIKQAEKLIDKNGPLSCAGVAEMMNIPTRSAQQTLHWLIKRGTHIRAENGLRYASGKQVVVYARATEPSIVITKQCKPQPRQIVASELNHAMAGWHPGAAKRHDLRGTA